MTYEEIKSVLASAGRRIDDGEYILADDLIRGAAANGASARDVGYLLGDDRLRQMRGWLSDRREAMTNGAARALYLQAYADGIESGDLLGPGAGPGEDWDDVAPPGAPASAVALAGVILHDVTDRAGGFRLDRLLGLYLEAGGPDAERFGHSLAMMALGHGVSPASDARGGARYSDPDVGLFEYGPWDIRSPAFGRVGPGPCRVDLGPGHAECENHAEPGLLVDDAPACSECHADAGEGGPACAECGHVFDDNPGAAMCRTCSDWIVTQEEGGPE